MSRKLKDLPVALRDLAIKNRKEQRYLINDLKEINNYNIDTLFDWGSTKEGAEFWSKVCSDKKLPEFLPSGKPIERKILKIKLKM